MNTETAIKIFEDRKVRTHWDEKTEEWYFSVTDVVEILTDSANPRDYWFKMKQRVKLEDGIELSTVENACPDNKICIT
jgi:prophage antirepressor-like protein